MPSVPAYLPNMNLETIGDVILLLVVHSVMYFVGVFFVYALDSLIIIIFVNMLMVASIIVEDIRKVQNVLQQRKISTTESKLRLIKCILMHKKYEE